MFLITALVSDELYCSYDTHFKLSAGDGNCKVHSSIAAENKHKKVTNVTQLYHYEKHSQ